MSNQAVKGCHENGTTERSWCCTRFGPGTSGSMEKGSPPSGGEVGGGSGTGDPPSGADGGPDEGTDRPPASSDGGAYGRSGGGHFRCAPGFPGRSRLCGRDEESHPRSEEECGSRVRIGDG